GMTNSEWKVVLQSSCLRHHSVITAEGQSYFGHVAHSLFLYRGGLAERLSRLQNRERSAVSFWRHQRDSDCKMPSGDKCGILMLKIIEVHEECSMQVALCQKLLDPSSSVTSSSTDCSPVKMLKVLFTCHTAAQLKGQPDDIIHIHPPWLKLNLRNESIPVILNTHFTQRVTGNVKDSKDRKGSAVLPDRRRPVPLSLVFKIDTEPDNKSKCEEPQKVRVGSQPCCQEQPSTLNFTVNDSLLDVVETQGAAGWSETSIRVVVQRVYGLPSRDGLGASSAHQQPCGGRAELCLLIQDAYGIFSELQLQCNYVTAADIENYSSRWEGRACCLSGMKILQRTTRGRAPGLFSLIDSLWPPLLPIKIHGQDQGQLSCCSEINLPPPSFCYILAVHHSEGGDRIQEEDKISDFYLPPVVHTLDKILQVVDILQRCSFWATVIYMKPETIHSDSSPQEDTWMFVTDVTLQHTSEGLLRPRVLAVCIPPSCVLDLNLLQTLCGNLPRTLYFKDTVKENGRIICIERTVLSLQKPLLSYAAGVSEPTGPVILDELDSRTEANSLCSVKGIIIGVNERASFSWPACNKCGSNKLQQSAGNRIKFFGVIGREVGPLDCFVQAWSGHPDSSLALEEICLASPGSG
uniref:Scaffold protein involved in DNA repair n=1 Tax=Leptobrachium leishanense TaxID=445787 RepID=A0A8C5Q739_9ANUR